LNFANECSWIQKKCWNAFLRTEKRNDVFQDTFRIQASFVLQSQWKFSSLFWSIEWKFLPVLCIMIFIWWIDVMLVAPSSFQMTKLSQWFIKGELKSVLFDTSLLCLILLSISFLISGKFWSVKKSYLYWLSCIPQSINSVGSWSLNQASFYLHSQNEELISPSVIRW
jgi:hypothetical protein